jgi:hypothetical protein
MDVSGGQFHALVLLLYEKILQYPLEWKESGFKNHR